MKIICSICGKEFEVNRRKGRGRSRIVCSLKCSQKKYYLRTKEEYIRRAREWDKKNLEKKKESDKKGFKKFREEKRERFNYLMRRNYLRNKKKQISRNATFRILSKNKKKFKLKKECKKCGIEKNLEIHHEIYPAKSKEIIKAMNDGKIYYLCEICHNNVPRKKEKKIKKKRDYSSNSNHWFSTSPSSISVVTVK